MAKINTPQIVTMVAIFAVLIGLIIFMRRNDEKEEYSSAVKSAMDNAARMAAQARTPAQRRAAAAAMKAASDMKKMFR